MASSPDSVRAQGTTAVLRHCRMSAFKARQVLDVIRGMDATKAQGILLSMDREAARVISKVLASAVANAENNDSLDPEELYIASCYADEGATYKRWRPRARGRATRIRKRTCHITVVVARMPEDRLRRHREREAASMAALRARRVARSRSRQRGTEVSRSQQAQGKQVTPEVEAVSRGIEESKSEGALGTVPAGTEGTDEARTEIPEETVSPGDAGSMEKVEEASSSEIVDVEGFGAEGASEGGSSDSDQGEGE
ncbi:MAG: 50S ribosomal protein L22 [Actinobacteria bacterium]|nr:50S ribosomal protein L22 [Actinomycetota bacterium]MCL6095794.1 50S ribosomal protein L22 [Actinomycetota bacterium]